MTYVCWGEHCLKVDFMQSKRTMYVILKEMCGFLFLATSPHITRQGRNANKPHHRNVTVVIVESVHRYGFDF